MAQITQQFTGQLSLPVSIKESETFDSFIQGQNEQVCQHLKATLAQFYAEPAKPIESWLTYLCSESHLGKSHLLYALCHQAELNQISAIYLTFKHIIDLTPDVLLGLEHYSVICLDDIHLIEGKDDWQLALFDLLNRVKESTTCSLVMTADKPAKSLAMTLPDLLSRLSWGTNFQLKSLSDEERQLALQVRAELRGMKMTTEVAKFLVNHWQRDMTSLINSLDQLDEQSLQQQRKLTIPFVKSILDI